MTNALIGRIGLGCCIAFSMMVTFRRAITPLNLMIWWADRAPRQLLCGSVLAFVATAAAYVFGQTVVTPPQQTGHQVLVSAATQFEYTAKVTDVYDGDTVTADLTTWIDPRTSLTFHGQRLRLLGIDAPELQEPTRIKGEAARDYLRNRLAAHGYMCEVETPGGIARAWDNFGRRLVYVWIRETPRDEKGTGRVRLNDELVAQGYARVYKP